MADNDPRPGDLVTLREASLLTGRSARTIRRWRDEGKLRTWAAREGAGAPPVVSRAELDTVAATAAVAATAPRALGGQRTRTTAAAATGWERAVDALRHERDDLVAQRDGLRRERDDARGEAARLAAEVSELRRRLEAVERELAGGVRGLLTTARRRLGLG